MSSLINRSKSKKKFLIYLLIALLILFTIHYYYVQYGRYDYDTKKDYHLSIENVRKESVKIVNGTILVDKELENGSSYFLKLRAKSTILGKLKDPYIEISSENHLIRNSFELGFDGIRYIDLTQHIENHSKKIQLTGKYCTIPD